MECLMYLFCCCGKEWNFNEGSCKNGWEHHKGWPGWIQVAYVKERIFEGGGCKIFSMVARERDLFHTQAEVCIKTLGKFLPRQLTPCAAYLNTMSLLGTLNYWGGVRRLCSLTSMQLKRLLLSANTKTWLKTSFSSTTDMMCQQNRILFFFKLLLFGEQSPPFVISRN